MNNIIKEWIQTQYNKGWETIVVNSVDIGYISSKEVYLVKYICSNRSEFFPDATEYRREITISLEDINKIVAESREKKLEKLGI